MKTMAVMIAALVMCSCTASWCRKDTVLAAKNLRAGHRIEHADLGLMISEDCFDAPKVPKDALAKQSDAIGHVLTRDVAFNEPIKRSELQ